MASWLDSIIISLFLTIAKRLVVKGLLEGFRIVQLEGDIRKAREYQKTVDNPEATREDRRRAEDDLLN